MLAAVITHVNEPKLKEAYKCRTSCKSRDMCLCKSNSTQNENILFSTFMDHTFSKLNLTQTFSHTHNKSKTILKTCKMSQNKFLYTWVTKKKMKDRVCLVYSLGVWKRLGAIQCGCGAEPILLITLFTSS